MLPLKTDMNLYLISFQTDRSVFRSQRSDVVSRPDHPVWHPVDSLLSKQLKRELLRPCF